MFFKKKTLSETVQAQDNSITLSSEEGIADVQAVMEKYDRESSTRKYTGIPKIITSCILALFSVYTLYMNLFSNWDNRARKASFVGFIIILAFMLYPVKKGGIKKENHIPWYDILLALGGCSGFFYFVFNFKDVVNRSGRLTTVEIVLGIISAVILFEACRRVVGIPILCVATAFIAYYGIFAFDRGLSVKTVVYNLFYTDSGIIGTPVNVCSTYIVLFILFGTFLEVTGVSEFFIKISNSIAGSSIGGPAKVAVISSALCGMVSGSSVANTVTTGSVTIPLMKKTGYKPEFAGAVEAAASTGGQIMPPIMGAAAFLMAEYMGIPYASVAEKAILPAFLYFSGIFMMVHLEAKKLGLKGLSRADLPKFLPLLLTEGFLLIPLILLIVLVITTQALATSAFLSIVITMAIASFVTSKNKSMLAAKIGATVIASGACIYLGVVSNYTKYITLALAAVILILTTIEKNDKMNINIFFRALAGGAKSCLSVGIACAVAGIIAGVVTKTDIASLLNSSINAVAGSSMFLALFLTMIACILLGMGVPTTANFVIMATTCAPILINMGIDKICAYMFVFYFGIVADITPPVALAAYAGSAIAKANPMKTGVNASKLAIAAFIIPYTFAFNPAMLFVDTTWYEVVQIIITSYIGMYAIAGGLEGYLKTKMSWIWRILAIVGGLMLIVPNLPTDIAGLLIVIAVFVVQSIATKKQKNTAAA